VVLPLAVPVVLPVLPLAVPVVLPLAVPVVLPLAEPTVLPLAEPTVLPLAEPTVPPAPPHAAIPNAHRIVTAVRRDVLVVLPIDECTQKNARSGPATRDATSRPACSNGSSTDHR